MILALGGASTVENVRLCCWSHNQLRAEQIFGRAHMARFRRQPALPASTAPGESGSAAAPG